MQMLRWKFWWIAVLGLALFCEGGGIPTSTRESAESHDRALVRINTTSAEPGPRGSDEDRDGHSFAGAASLKGEGGGSPSSTLERRRRALQEESEDEPLAQSLKDRVQEWCANAVSAGGKYGNISDWDTSAVTDMDSLFKQVECSKFNDDISKWNTSSVTDMRCVVGCTHAAAFEWGRERHGGTAYDGRARCAASRDVRASRSHLALLLARWPPLSRSLCSRMFHGASAFNQSIGGWNTLSVTNMKCVVGVRACRKRLVGDVEGVAARRTMNERVARPRE